MIIIFILPLPPKTENLPLRNIYRLPNLSYGTAYYPTLTRIWGLPTTTLPSPLNLGGPLNTHNINDINMI